MRQIHTAEWKPRALVVDDVEVWRELPKDALERKGWRVDTTKSIEDALEKIRIGNTTYNLAIVDKGGSGKWTGERDIFGHRDGLKVLKDLMTYQPDCIRILATGEPWRSGAFNDPELGVQVFYDKRSGKMQDLINLLENWKPREDGFPHLFLYEKRRDIERL
jgi:ActR/RegA family two-component response regulator